MVKAKSKGEKVFDICNIFIMLFLVIITVYPMYYVAVCSFADSSELLGNNGIILWPKGFNLAAYKSVFGNPNILTGYSSTLFVVIAGTVISVIMTSVGAFLITRKHFAVRKFISYLFVFTMYFSGGMIPTFIVVYKWIHLGDSLWAVILTQAVSTYNMLIMKSSFEAVPDSLEESAKIDGANDIIVLLRIILPLSLSIIAVMVLFYSVNYWNSWFNAMVYIRTRSKYPLQLILREILLMNDISSMNSGASVSDQYMIGEGIRYATIMVATVPILCVYPFIQKYFVKGIMVGAVKG